MGAKGLEHAAGRIQAVTINGVLSPIFSLAGSDVQLTGHPTDVRITRIVQL